MLVPHLSENLVFGREGIGVVHEQIEIAVEVGVVERHQRPHILLLVRAKQPGHHVRWESEKGGRCLVRGAHGTPRGKVREVNKARRITS